MTAISTSVTEMTDAQDWPETSPIAPSRPVAVDASSGARNRDAPLVPPSTISARALVMVIVIMSFLASMAAGAAVLVGRASQQWSADVSREVSVQIRARAGVDLDREVARVSDVVRGVSGVAGLHAFSRDESEKLLEPWLGQNLNFDELPVPRLIVVALDRANAEVVEALRDALKRAAPNAMFDDHRAWSERLSTMGRTLVVVAVLVLILILVAMALAVAFATSGAMAGSREIVDVLHFVGATDDYICRQYQRQFLVFGLKGGCIGAFAACVAFAMIGWLSQRWAATTGGGQVEALFGSFSLGTAGYLCIALIALFTAAIVTVTSRFIVAQQLRALI